jgi:hypothetical protein
MDSSTFAAPLEREEEIYISPRESLKAGTSNNGYTNRTVNKDVILKELYLESASGFIQLVEWEKSSGPAEDYTWTVD